MEALPAAGTPCEHVEVLAFTIPGRQIGAAFLEAVIKYLEASFKDVCDIAKESGGALLSLLLYNKTESGDGLTPHRRCRWRSGLGSHFVATDIGEADGLENVDAINNPTDLRFPVDGLQNAARSGRSDDVVGDALDLHFRPREAGVFAADVELNAV